MGKKPFLIVDLFNCVSAKITTLTISFYFSLSLFKNDFCTEFAPNKTIYQVLNISYDIPSYDRFINIPKQASHSFSGSYLATCSHDHIPFFCSTMRLNFHWIPKKKYLKLNDYYEVVENMIFALQNVWKPPLEKQTDCVERN